MREVERVRIWDSGSPEVRFGAAVSAFAAQVDLGQGTGLFLLAPNAGTTDSHALVAFAHGPRAREAQQAWLRFVSAGPVPAQPEEAAEEIAADPRLAGLIKWKAGPVSSQEAVGSRVGAFPTTYGRNRPHCTTTSTDRLSDGPRPVSTAVCLAACLDAACLDLPVRRT